MAVQPETQVKAKYIRIRVVDQAKDGHPAVNVRIPFGVAKFGLKMAQRFSPELKNAELDWGAIEAMIDEGMTGELVHVEDEQQSKTVDVYVE
jgi:hypothetical protein